VVGGGWWVVGGGWWVVGVVGGVGCGGWWVVGGGEIKVELFSYLLAL
jgi:hypothetical protein